MSRLIYFLSISLASFLGNAVKAQNTLKWEKTNENVIAACETSSEKSNSHYVLPISYYRLTQDDYDGTTEILAIKPVNFNPSTDESWIVFQHPAYGKSCYICLTNETKRAPKNIKLYASKGDLVFNETIAPNANLLSLNHASALTSNVYTLVIMDMGVKKLIVKS